MAGAGLVNAVVLYHRRGTVDGGYGRGNFLALSFFSSLFNHYMYSCARAWTGWLRLL
jgi:hypothetical protein